MMGEDEHRRVVRRFLSPPTFPVFVRPRPANRAKHVSPENPGADVGEPLLDDFVVDAGFAATLSMHFLPKSPVKQPIHQLNAANAQRVLKVLARTRAITIN